MVVNEGEIDLYLNFACSCQQNNVTIKVCDAFTPTRLCTLVSFHLLLLPLFSVTITTTSTDTADPPVFLFRFPSLLSSTKNLLVFAASPEIVTMIESTGAMGIYHPGYAAVE